MPVFRRQRLEDSQPTDGHPQISTRLDSVASGSNPGAKTRSHPKREAESKQKERHTLRDHLSNGAESDRCKQMHHASLARRFLHKLGISSRRESTGAGAFSSLWGVWEKKTRCDLLRRTLISHRLLIDKRCGRGRSYRRDAPLCPAPPLWG